MPVRIRHCVECPKCLTRYLIASSPYRNGSYVVPAVPYLSGNYTLSDEYILFCTCGNPRVASRWHGSAFKSYRVSKAAHKRGFGPPEEIVPVRSDERESEFLWWEALESGSKGKKENAT